MLSIDGEDKESLIRGDYNVELRVEHERMRKLGIETMEEYGLNPEKPLKSSKHPAGQTTSEWTVFLSETIRDLAFERYVEYMTKTNDPVCLTWTLKDLGPTNLLDRIRRK